MIKYQCVEDFMPSGNENELQYEREIDMHMSNILDDALKEGRK